MSFFKRIFLVYAELERFTSVKVSNKPHVEIYSEGFISNIVEKRIISAEISSGLIGFQSTSDFLRAIQKVSGSREKDVSDIVRYLLGDGEIFWRQSASDCIDWGTLVEWKRYCSIFATIVVGIYGVLATIENPQGNEGNNLERNSTRLSEYLLPLFPPE